MTQLTPQPDTTLRAWLSERGDYTPGVRWIQLARKAPVEVRGISTKGLHEILHEPIDESHIADRWGGGTWIVGVYEAKGDAEGGKCSAEKVVVVPGPPTHYAMATEGRWVPAPLPTAEGVPSTPQSRIQPVAESEEDELIEGGSGGSHDDQHEYYAPQRRQPPPPPAASAPGMNQLMAFFQREISELRRQITTRPSESELGDAYSSLLEAQRAQMKTLQEQAQNAAKTANDPVNTLLEHTKTTMEAQITGMRDQLKAQSTSHQAAFDALTAQHKEQLAAAETRWKTQVETMKAQHEAEMRSTDRTNAATKELGEKTHLAEVRALDARLLDAQEEVKRLQRALDEARSAAHPRSVGEMANELRATADALAKFGLVGGGKSEEEAPEKPKNLTEAIVQAVTDDPRTYLLPLVDRVGKIGDALAGRVSGNPNGAPAALPAGYPPPTASAGRLIAAPGAIVPPMAPARAPRTSRPHLVYTAPPSTPPPPAAATMATGSAPAAPPPLDPLQRALLESATKGLEEALNNGDAAATVAQRLVEAAPKETLAGFAGADNEDVADLMAGIVPPESVLATPRGRNYVADVWENAKRLLGTAPAPTVTA